MKKKTRKAGTSAGVALAALLLSAAMSLAGAEKDKKQPEPFGIVAGTVFEENGRALPHADIALERSGTPANELRKVKKIRYTTDARGEFAIRVPVAKQEYLLTVTAPGFETQQKPVTFSGEDRVNVFIRLQAASK
ncbi:MAG TPA: carboxypeptidase-like regulatory domain-containing protein [Bryobacteraceae bacterium]|nr:carboxypeptidase-like regulatory domain-containing protein [Bryobacteraceae bacterium]